MIPDGEYNSAGGNPVDWTRRKFIRNSGVAALGLGAVPVALESATTLESEPGNRRPPNLIFILTDQQRFDTLGCNGNTFAITPHLDALAAEGTRFERAYVAQPSASPSRSSILTGLFPHKTDVTETDMTLTDHSLSFPRILHEAGYATGYIGKWHLGPCPRADLSADSTRSEPAPAFFDEWDAFESARSHWVGQPRSRWAAAFNRSELPDFSEFSGGIFRADHDTDKAIAFLTQHPQRPFLLFLSFSPPHSPWTAPPENCARFKGRCEYPVYHAMINRIDENIGRLRKAVDDLGMQKDTLVVFTSNYGHLFEHRWNDQTNRICHEEAVRIPLIIHGPGRIPRGVRRELVSQVDIAPTILDLCGIPPPVGCHGRSLKNSLPGGDDGASHSVYIQNNPFRRDANQARNRGWAAMSERCVVKLPWKLILNTHRPPELYSLDEDPAEAMNRWEDSTLTAVKRELLGTMEEWALKTGDALTMSQWLLYKWTES